MGIQELALQSTLEGLIDHPDLNLTRTNEPRHRLEIGVFLLRFMIRCWPLAIIFHTRAVTCILH